MSQRTPTQAEVINRALELFSAGLYVCRPGVIHAINTSTLLCDVKPLLKDFFENASGDTVVEPLPVIPGCVLYQAEGGGFVDTFPVQAGDACWLIFADRSLNRWQAGNGDTDPVFVNRHDLSGAVVLVGGRPKAHAITEFDTSRRVIGKQGGPRIALADTSIHLGVDHNENATEAALLGSKYTSEEATSFNVVATQLTALSAAMTALATAAVGPLAPLAAAFGTAATAATAAASEFTTFALAQSTRLSTRVKLK